MQTSAAGPVRGVGIDIVSVQRFAAALQRTPRLADRVFAAAERTTVSGVARSTASLAARFAAKEAVAKALGAPRGLDWHDCVIAVDAAGRPWVTVSGSVAAACVARGIDGWQLSLTHDAGIAAAIVVGLAAGEDVIDEATDRI